MNRQSRGEALAYRLIMSTHNAEHVKLSKSQRQDVQNLNEAFAALSRKTSAIENATASWSHNSFGNARPSRSQQLVFFDFHREFFDLCYSTLSAMAACLNRLTKLVQSVEWRTNEKFLRWLRLQRPSRIYLEHVEILQAARDFRTIYTHPAQWKPVDWLTAGSGRTARVVLQGTHPPVPPGVSVSDQEEGTWFLHSPNPERVLFAFEAVTIRFFGQIMSFYDEDPQRCTWEADDSDRHPTSP